MFATIERFLTLGKFSIKSEKLLTRKCKANLNHRVEVRFVCAYGGNPTG